MNGIKLRMLVSVCRQIFWRKRETVCVFLSLYPYHPHPPDKLIAERHPQKKTKKKTPKSMRVIMQFIKQWFKHEKMSEGKY